MMNRGKNRRRTRTPLWGAARRVAPSSDTSISEFPQFSKFPIEIRFKIWHSVNNEARFIDVFSATNFRDAKKNDRSGRAGPRGPAILYACRESRAAALEIYRLIDRGVLIFVNPQIDTLSFFAHEQFDNFMAKKENMKRVDVKVNKICSGAMVLSKQEMKSQAACIYIHSCGSYPNALIRYRALNGLRRLTLRHIKIELICGDHQAMWKKWEGLWVGKYPTPDLVLQATGATYIQSMGWVLKTTYYEAAKKQLEDKAGENDEIISVQYESL